MDLMVYFYGGKSATNEDKGFGQKITWDIPLLDGYEHQFIKNSSRSKGMNTGFFDAVNWSIFRIIRKSDDQIILLNGWAYLSDWFVLLAAKFHGKKVWMRAEMPWNQEELKPKSFKKSLKYFLFKYIIFKFFVEKFLYIGTQNKRYYQMHGIKEERLIYGPYSVENERFQDQKTDGNVTREKWGINKDQVVILFSGKLVDKKRPLDLLKAFNQMKSNNSVLFYMGDGPLRSSMEKLINDNNIQKVIISGFINQSEISSIYSLADIFVMSSGIGETWGLSVNEAMNFGLPVIISSTCGSSFDLVEEGKNGFVYAEGDVNALERQLETLVSNQNLRKSMGVYSQEKIAGFSHQVTCQNIAQHLLKI
jgi:glycosyltransferase involved in cell wall biosynthesis